MSTLEHHHCFRNGRTPTYHSWQSMRARMRPSHRFYPRYGGRGIKVCERWMTFAHFLADMGERPAGTSLDRIDNDGDYEPGNCRWALPGVQQGNRWNTHNITFNGETLSMAAWGRRLGIRENTICGRLKRGWPVERALATQRFGRHGQVVR